MDAPNETETLGTALPKEIERVQELIPIYESIGPAGQFAIHFMKQSIKEAHRAMIEGDLVGMIQAYKSLQEYKA